jgi:tetratricopeptide (TPR) repeat protein
MALLRLHATLAQAVPALRPGGYKSAMQLSAILLDSGADMDGEAYAALAETLGETPSDRAGASGIRAVALHRLGRSDEELSVLQSARNHLDEGAVDAVLLDEQIAELLLERGSLDEAEVAARRTLAAEDPWAQQAFTAVLRAQGRTEDALAHQRTIVDRLDP